MRSKPYLFFKDGRWHIQWHRPIDGLCATALCVSFDRACSIAAYLVRRYGLVAS